mgnify:CR=1 FL=1
MYTVLGPSLKRLHRYTGPAPNGIFLCLCTGIEQEPIPGRFIYARVTIWASGSTTSGGNAFHVVEKRTPSKTWHPAPIVQRGVSCFHTIYALPLW